MSRADYAHWNEEADYMWWHEEGKHAESDAEMDEYEMYSAADAFAEELGEYELDHLYELLGDAEYLARWPRAKPLIEWELKFRGEEVS